MDSAHDLLAAANLIRNADLTPLELVVECLGAINRFESRASAWVAVDASGALEAAERLTRELADGKYRGPLHGIPVGVKDVVDVALWPTRAGSTLTAARAVSQDAAVVERLRVAGAIILGKTVTTEFACFDPPPTRNPWNLDHTPGGSSSGSAAAVALGMCSAAIGSQTGGSITRPASYCGVAGVKPTFGRVSRRGVVPVSFHLDHVGAIARTAADCAVLVHAMAGDDPRDPAASPRENFTLPEALSKPPRLGVIWPYFFEQEDHEVAQLARVAWKRLVEQGAQPIELALPDGFEQVHAMHRRIMAVEAADYHRAFFGAPRAGYGPKLAAMIDEGLAVSMSEYQESLRHQTHFRNATERLLADVDALVTPAAHTAAPASRDKTGDPRFNSPWSHAGVPTVSIPCGLTADGMPIALQFVGRAWSESRLLATAIWSEQRLGFCAAPPMVSTPG